MEQVLIYNPFDYSLFDNTPNTDGIVNYKLIQFDFDGSPEKCSYSNKRSSKIVSIEDKSVKKVYQ